jgi:cytochrome c biogenesis protein CcmG, thiol:disulfide interchange protein DsbE
MQTMQALARIRSILPVLAVLLAPLLAGAQAPSTTFDLAEHQGKVVVIDFWASWCVPCRRSFPWLNEMYSKYGDEGLVVIGVNLDANRDDATAFLKDYPATFQIHFDSNASLAKEYGVEAMPSSFVIGRDGQVKARHLGFKVKRQDEYEATLVEALGEKS